MKKKTKKIRAENQKRIYEIIAERKKTLIDSQ